jgi:hypothetical protein
VIFTRLLIWFGIPQAFAGLAAYAVGAVAIAAVVAYVDYRWNQYTDGLIAQGRRQCELKVALATSEARQLALLEAAAEINIANARAANLERDRANDQRVMANVARELEAQTNELDRLRREKPQAVRCTVPDARVDVLNKPVRQ